MVSNDILNALIGGGLIGVSATLMLRWNGKIAGISGIFDAGVFAFYRKGNAWRVFFLMGLLLGGMGLALFYPSSLVNTLETPGFLVALGGVLVGFGTRMGGGCTSGHGVCGNARLSKRSMVATLCFMGAGFLTVALVFHGFSLGGL